MARRWQASRALAGVLLTLLVLAGCSTRGPAPVTERGIADLPADRTHVVRRGDTLYSIAWRYGLDWQRLARANAIAAPYTIGVGQRIDLRVDRAIGSSRTSAPERTVARPATPARTPPAAPSQAAPPKAAPPKATPPRSEPRPAPEPSTRRGPLRWAWPLEGPVVAAFGSGATPNKGIDVRAGEGVDVRVAAAGEVVYAGSGLRGHESLVIVKHDDTWLSAYAYNDRIRVREGQRLDDGATLARIAGEDARRRLLHFEIRRDGKPVDPAGLLPRR